MDLFFACYCGQALTTTLEISEPDYSADQDDESGSESQDSYDCPHCNETHEIKIISYMYGNQNISINGDSNIHESHTAPYDEDQEYQEEMDWLIHNKDSHGIFHKNMSNVENLLKLYINDKSVKQSLDIMIFGNIVAAIEGYLASIFFSTVMDSPEKIRKFVELESDFSKKNGNFELKEIFNVYDQINKMVAKEVKDIIFHKVGKVAPLFKNILGYDFGDFSWLGDAVSIRHDCVHRAGLTKEGKPVNIDELKIKELIQRARNLVNDIDEKITQVVKRNKFLEFKRQWENDDFDLFEESKKP